MTDDQKKAKHEFAMHQDNLLWSRMQLVVAIQGGVLAGTHYLQKDLPVAIGLTVLGTLLTVFAVMLMKRDDDLGSQAFIESGVPKTNVDGSRWFRGRYFAYIAVGLLILSDWLLLGYVLSH